MPAEVYEVLALLARFWFLFLMVVIVWYSYRWYARDRRVRKERLEELPDAGFIGELVVMQTCGGLKAGAVFSVPFEGYLGTLRTGDIHMEQAGESIAPRHIWFQYDRKRGLLLVPVGDNDFMVDELSSADHPDGLYVAHGSWLRIGDLLLRLRMFQGYEAEKPVRNAAPAASPEPQRRPQPLPLPDDVHEPLPPMARMHGAATAESMQQPVYRQQPAFEPEYGYAPGMQAAPRGQYEYRQFASDACAPERQSRPGQWQAEAPSMAFAPRRSDPGVTGTHTAPAAANRIRFSGQPVRRPQNPFAEPRPVPAGETDAAFRSAAAESSTRLMPRGMASRPAASSVRPDAFETTAHLRQHVAPAGAAEPRYPGARGAEMPARPPYPASRSFAAESEALREPVFAEPVQQETFHPFVDAEDWDELAPQEDWDTGNEAPQEIFYPLEGDWPYLSRTEQWQTDALFADLLDEDGTDAATPGSACRSDAEGGFTARIGLKRYFKGGGLR